MNDLRILLKKYIEEGDGYFPDLFHLIKPSLYFPVIKYRNFLPDGVHPDAEFAARDGFSDLFAFLCKHGGISKYDAITNHVYSIWGQIKNSRSLEKYYYENRDSAGIKNGLRRIAKNYIYGDVIKKEPELSRIFKRMKKILKEGLEFKIFPSIKDKWWGLRSWLNPKEFLRSMDEMRERLSPIPAVNRVKERPDAKKASVVLSNPRLKGLMIRILEILKMTLTPSLFIKAIGLKVPIIDAGFTDLDRMTKPGEEGEDSGGGLRGIVPAKRSSSPGMTEDAEDFYAALTERQRQVLRLYWLEESRLKDTGAAMGISKSLVAIEKDSILEKLREEIWESLEEFELFVVALRNVVLEKSGD